MGATDCLDPTALPEGQTIVQALVAKTTWCAPAAAAAAAAARCCRHCCRSSARHAAALQAHLACTNT